METTDRAKHLLPEEGKSLWVAGELVTLKVVGEETDGAFALLEDVTPPQGGPPPHIHYREDETFYVLEGVLEFLVGESTFRATAGSVVYAPRNLLHTYKNVGTTSSKMLVLVAPAGLERFFEEVGESATDPSSPPPFGQVEIEKLLAVAPKYGQEIPPPSAEEADPS
jgi:quercetin dioxygenase-like cupin family protein